MFLNGKIFYSPLYFSLWNPFISENTPCLRLNDLKATNEKLIPAGSTLTLYSAFNQPQTLLKSLLKNAADPLN